MLRRTLVTALLLVAAMPIARAAGDARTCPVDDAAVAAVARDASGGLFTRPESTVPTAKRTTRGLYLTAQDAYDMVSEAPDKVLFIDVRTRGEPQFIGMPTLVDAHVPLLVETVPPQWDEANSTFKLTPNPTFVGDVGKRLARKGLTRDDPVIVICQAGLPWTAKLDRTKMYALD